MRRQMLTKRILAAFLSMTCVLGTFSVNPMHLYANEGNEDAIFIDMKEQLDSYSIDDQIPSYEDYINQYEGYYPDKVIDIKTNETSEEAGLNCVIYDFEVEESGFYDIALTYYPIEGKGSEIQRAIFIDGKLPYEELALIELNRIWEIDCEETTDAFGNTVRNWEKDNQGNDLKPSLVERPDWITEYIYDSKGYYDGNLKIFLEEGKHSVSIMNLREPAIISDIIFSNHEPAKSYEKQLEVWDSLGAEDTTSQSIRIEGENASRVSSQMLYPKQDQSSPAIFPCSPKELLNNSIGGTSYQNAGEWIEWDVEIAQDGYYNIGLYDKQNFVRGINISRRITIDGEVPFDEMNSYEFAYSQNWRQDELADADGTPYKFYLTKGTHTIRMEVVLGDLSSIIGEVQDSVLDLNAIYRKVIRITGVSPDKYRDYQIAAALPDLEGELIDVRGRINDAIERLEQIEGENTDKITSLVTMRDQLDELIKDQERFTEVISSYKVNVRACGNWIGQVINQPLQIDRLYIYSPDSKPNIEGANFFERLWFEIKRLFYSFIIDYNCIGNIADKDSEGEIITLWIGTGRDQANVVKSLIDEEFTKNTGINVNVQLVDMSTLLKASLAKEGPDVAISVGPTQVATSQVAANLVSAANDTPVNYGIRNAVLDLRQFDDYEEVASRFAPAAMVPYTYDGATYALPETMSYLMMFYRKDIMKEIGLELPKTWDDVKVTMTVLSKNQMDFGMFPGEQIFAMLLYQHGGSYYTEDGDRSALDTDVAVNAFKEYCEFYTDYKIDKETSVEERFRTGECPIIIADYTTYNNLCISAPDIEGLWDFTVVPGIANEDGTINHTTGSIGLADMIMADTEHKEASWEFLKWWTSDETQTKYGREMENLMGQSARVATANLNAMANLSWSRDDYAALNSQLEQVKGIEQVPGGYYTWRNVNNAFYTITATRAATGEPICSSTPREELMQNVTYINAEIKYKRQELGLE